MQMSRPTAGSKFPRARSVVAAVLVALLHLVTLSGQTVRVGAPAGGSSPAILSSGSGSPEAAVYGSPGDQYYCRSSCSGSIGWYKATGTATNTGWIAYGSGAGSVTSVGLSAPAVFAVASSPVTTSGTIAVTFNGGLSTFTQGDLWYVSASNTLSRLAKDTNATRYLSNTGASNAPAWAQLNLSNGVTSTLAEGNGGTGITALGTGVGALLGTPSSANLRAALTDEVGTGAAYFVGGALGTPASVNLSNGSAFPFATGGTGVVPAANGGAGTVSGILKANGSGTVSAATSATDYAPATSGSVPLFGNGSGGFTNGTVQGNTTKVVTYAGSAPATNDCAKFDSSGNVTTAAAACGSGSGGGSTVNLGSLVLLYETTAAASSSIDVVTRNVLGQSGAIFQSDFDEYEVVIVDAVAASNGVTPALTFSTNGGSTYASTTYEWSTLAYPSGSTTGSAGSASATSNIRIGGNYAGATLGNTAGYSWSARFRISGVNSSTLYKRVRGEGLYVGNSSNGTAIQDTFGGAWATTTAANAFRVALSSGNITSGKFRVYGVANSATTTAASGGSLILRETKTASASASLDFTSCLSSAYDSYYIDLQGIVLSGNNHLWWRAGTGSGPTYDSGANYSNDQFVWRAGGSGGAGSTGLTKIALTYLSSTPSASSTLAWSGHLTVGSPQSASLYKNVEGRLVYSDTGFRVSNEFRGTYESATAMTAFQILPSAGTITSGIVRCYAISSTVPQLGPMNYMVANGRLTTETAVPVSISDRTAQSTVYLTPYQGNQIGLYTAGVWGVIPFAETSIALSGLTSAKNYDVFAYANGGTLALELSAAWSSDTARTDAVSLQDGIYVKTSDKSRRLVGTFRTTATTTTEDSAAKRFVWNVYNRRPRTMRNATETADSWPYNSTTWRQANANTANQLSFVMGLAEDATTATVAVTATGSAAYNTAVAIGCNSTSTTSSPIPQLATGAAVALTTAASCPPVSGYSFVAWLEADGGASTYYGDGGGTLFQSGLTGTIDN